MCLLQPLFPGVFTSVKSQALLPLKQRRPSQKEKRRLRFTLGVHTIAGAGLAMKKPETQDGGAIELCAQCRVSFVKGAFVR